MSADDADLSGRQGDRRRFVVLNDAPVGENGNEDLLSLESATRQLANLIIESRSVAPFTLAIDADWGMGKSSLMRQLHTALDAGPDVSSVWFNAWTAGRADMLEGLIKTVLLSLDRNVIRRAVRSLSRRTQLLSAARVGLMVAASYFGLGGVVDQIWKVLATDAKSRNEIKGVLRDTLKGWTERSSQPGGQHLLVVFVDDLDRCSSDRIIEVCEAIKLYLDVPGVVFVVSCDQSMLLQAIGDSNRGDTARALKYLEKIIQINYRIPAPSSDRVQGLVDGYLARSGTDEFFDDTMKKLISDRSGRNPRRIKRLINSFVVEYRLNPEWEQIGIESLIKITLLQHFYPDFYRRLVNPNDDDPVQDFLAYHRFRSVVKQGGELDMAATGRLFTAKGLKPMPPDVDDERLPQCLHDLEQELPVDFPLLATDREFVSLMESLRFPMYSYQLRHLLRRPLAPLQPTVADTGSSYFLTSPVAAGLDTEAIRGLRILRISAKQHDPWLTARLKEFGAEVDIVADRESAVEMLRREVPDLIVSNISRRDDPNGGLDDVVYFRDEDLFDGPVVFYTYEITPARQNRVRELGTAAMTNNPNEVLWLIAKAAAYLDRSGDIREHPRPGVMHFGEPRRTSPDEPDCDVL